MKHKNDVDPLDYKNFFSYLKARFDSAPAGKRITETFKHFKKYFFISKILRYIRIVFIWIQTGAYLIVSATFLIILIPIIIILILMFFLQAVMRYGLLNRKFRSLLKGKNVYVCFDNDDEAESKDIKEKAINEADLGGFVFIVSETAFSLPFSSVKKLSENMYTVSMDYFYSLKKYVFEKNCVTVTYLEL